MLALGGYSIAKIVIGKWPFHKRDKSLFSLCPIGHIKGCVTLLLHFSYFSIFTYLVFMEILICLSQHSSYTSQQMKHRT